MNSSDQYNVIVILHGDQSVGLSVTAEHDVKSHALHSHGFDLQ
jgi:hypothetical protein